MSSRASNLLYFLLIFIHGNLLEANLFDEIEKQNDILSAKDAFQLSILVKRTDTTLKWEIAPKHYLYLDDIKIKYNELDIEYSINKSNQSRYDDIFFGNVPILKDEFEISASMPEIINIDRDTITIYYRGCAEAGFCYPMETLSFRISDKIL